MNSIVKSSARNTRALGSSFALKQILRRGVSTQELDATKGGRSRNFPEIRHFLMMF